MAVTFTGVTEAVMGNCRVRMGTITLDAVTSGAVDSGLARIYGGSVVRSSWTSTLLGQQVLFNSGSGGTAINGYVQIVTGTAGDAFEAVLFGR